MAPLLLTNEQTLSYALPEVTDDHRFAFLHPWKVQRMQDLVNDRMLDSEESLGIGPPPKEGGVMCKKNWSCGTLKNILFIIRFKQRSEEEASCVLVQPKVPVYS